MKRIITLVASSALVVLVAASAPAQTARVGLWARRMQAQTQTAVPAGTRVISNMRYGDDPRQRLDVYAPPQAHAAPVIFMVHGGAWAFGTKTARGVVENKVARWVPRGFMLISVDYRMLPDAAPRAQAEDVARALAFAQHHASEWGGDPAQFILMGHSAGAHLVSLITANPAIARQAGAQAWLGTVSLDSAALDVVALMQRRHLPLYDRAFGSDTANWMAASPLQQMHDRIVPFLAVCSTRRNQSCSQAQRFVDKAVSLGSSAKVLPEDLTHEQINEQVGTAGGYTAHIEAFMRTLSPGVASRLSN
ncbi:alpha/beta hydrolase [Dyella monticola]|uniref:Alpha/beta hydrolase n=1 Tax=Dyella monticola TaxID=1927958 RepID=A0A370WUJ6_9GAMM|nr:alpha/beta hydrolase [Dyella monticola]RDS79731.1 alpha/beta hydrolase [Dyella monticola]